MADAFSPDAAWHISLHAAPRPVVPGPPVMHAGRSVASVRFDQAASDGFSVTFEAAVAALETWPRMFVEPDGALVWTGESDGRRWQLDGTLYDRDGRLWYVELKGACPRPELQRLLTLLGWPSTAVVVQLVQQAAFIAWEDFLEDEWRADANR